MKHIVIACFLITAFISNSSAHLYQVGPTRQYVTPSKVMALVQDGDTVEIDPVLYSGDVGTWSKNNLLIRGANSQYTHLDAAGKSAGGKAIWVIAGKNTTIEYIEFSGATVVDKNGAGIRQEGADLTVRHCYFHDNEDGILAGDNPTSTILIEYSEFARNGFGDGYSHNMYINHIQSFTLQYCYTHQAKVGHCIKSRAYTNNILYNRIMDETEGSSSYLINLPNGGLSFVVGNVCMKGALSEGSALLDYGSEGYSNPTNEIYVVNNTWCNRKPNAQFYHIYNGASKVFFRNNIFAGPGIISNDTILTSSDIHLSLADDPGFVDPQHFDFHLTKNSTAIDAGLPPVAIPPGYDFVLDKEYVDTATYKARPINGASIDVGAFEFVGQNVVNTVSSQESNVTVFPNPMKSSATITFMLKERCFVDLSLFTIDGKTVTHLIRSEYDEGLHTITFPTQSFSNGHYLFLLQSTLLRSVIPIEILH